MSSTPTVVQCPRCNAENAREDKSCGACGMRLPAVCPSCGVRNPWENKFCGQCGTALDLTTAPLKFTRAEDYTPKHLAEKILISRTALQGERKQVTVLFADMKGSLALVADQDPEEARMLLDPVIERMMEAVHRYEGTVNQVMGDGIMAIFGAPVAHEDHAVRACYAALRMKETIAQLASEILRTRGTRIEIRTGLNSGEVVVRSIGSDLRMDYTAVGQTTHLAARLEQIAEVGSILITSECLRLAEGYVETKPLGPVAVRGLTNPVELHEVVAAAPIRSRLQAAAARGLTPFVGRRPEIEILHEVLRRAAASSGQVLAAVGEAGVGKSRLLHEFIHSPHVRGWLVLESKSISYGRATPYLPLIDFLKGYFKLLERDDTRTIREKVTGKIILLDQSLQESIPPVLELLGALPDDHPFRRHEPAHRQQLTARAVTQLMLSESRIQPVIMVFEDLHWTDMQTLGLLKAMVSSIRDSRMLLLASYRPKDHVDQWEDQPHYRQVELKPLAQESLEQLLQILLGEDPQLRSVKEFLVERSGGNPFFVEEIIRSLVEAGVLDGTRGQYRLAKPLSSVQVPDKVRAVISARIDRLAPEQKRLLQQAAVIGKDVPFVLLHAIAGIPDHDLRARLGELRSAEYLYESRLFPELEYTFKHSLTREVAYSTLLREHTRTIHAQVAEVLESLAGGRVEDYVEQIAEHAEHGHLWPKAVKYLQQAGEKAFALYANEEAEKYFQRAVDALERLPRTAETLGLAADLRFELRNALIPRSQLTRIRTILDQIEPLVAELGDKARRARYAAFKCNHHFLAGEQKRAIDVGEAGLVLAEDAGELRIKGELLYRIGQSYHLLGDNQRAQELLEQSVALTAEPRERTPFDLSVLPTVVNRLWLVSVLAECGDFRSGVAQAKGALEIAEQANHPLSEVIGWLALGHVLRRKGELDGAINALERGVALSDRYSLPMWRLRVLSSLGVAYAYSGRVTEGLELTAQALNGAENMSLMVDQPMLHVHLGQALLLAGRIEDAMRHARRALKLARAHEDRMGQAWAGFLVARCCLHGGGTIDQALACLESALVHARMCGARPLAAFCQSSLASAYAARGNQSKLHDHAAKAEAIYAELDLRPLVLEPLRRELLL
jgi:class 3 adenylate cyclase/tetratricopeptide (TPR) repeat protein